MHVTNWGMFLLGVYLVFAGLTSVGVFGYLSGMSQLRTLAPAARSTLAAPSMFF